MFEEKHLGKKLMGTTNYFPASMSSEIANRIEMFEWSLLCFCLQNNFDFSYL